MNVEELKVFIHGLPPDCQENSLKDFFEGDFKNELECTYKACGYWLKKKWKITTHYLQSNASCLLC